MYNLFGSQIQRHIEKKSRYEAEIKSLKNQQQIQYENVVTEYKERIAEYENNVKAREAELTNQIKLLRDFKEEHLATLNKQMKFELDQLDDKYEYKILNIKNRCAKLTNLIAKEQKDMKDLTATAEAQASGTSKKILNENVAKKPKKKTAR